jgi:flagellar biosynthesis protein FliR
MNRWMTLEYFSGFVTLIAFTYAGLVVARKRTRPVHVAVWIVLALFVLLGWTIGVNARIIDIFGFKMCLNEMIEGFAIGLLIGLLVKKSSIAGGKLTSAGG